MESFLYYITEQLSQEGNSTLPGMGRLHMATDAARWHAQEEKFYPPEKHIVFDETIKKDAAPSIIDFVAHHENIAHEVAMQHWEKQSEAWKAGMRSGRPVVIPGVGSLSMDEKENIGFEEKVQALFAPVAAVALTRQKVVSIDTDTATENVEEANVPPYPSFDDKAPTLLRWWWIAAGGLVIVALVFFLFFRNRTSRNGLVQNNDEQPLQTAAQADSTPASDSAAQNGTAYLPANDSIHYHIVIGSYTLRDRAEKQYSKMKNWGHPVELLRPDSSRYLLGMSFTSLPADTTVNLINMMKLYGSSVYIVYP